MIVRKATFLKKMVKHSILISFFTLGHIVSIAQTAPTASAGPDITVALPKNSCKLYGAGLDPDGGDLSYQWYLQSSPISGATSPMLVLTNLTAGTYTYRLTVTDNTSNSASDDVIVTVATISNNYAFAREEEINIAGITDKNQISGLAVGDKAADIVYFNNYGSPMEKVSWKASPLGNDIMVPIVYDELGRQVKSYLPVTYPQTTANFQTLLDGSGEYTGTVAGFYADKPYALTKLELSPLNRPIEQGSVGQAWQPGFTSGTQKITYGTNAANEIRKWASVATPVSIFSYLANRLNVKTTTDYVSDQIQTITQEFTNTDGLTILKRVKLDATNWAETYYVYDDNNNLRFVIPPPLCKDLKTAGNYIVTADQTNRWCFEMLYDKLNRRIATKGPGTDWSYSVYDKKGRLVFSQDGNMALANKWVFTKYDVMDRPVITGLYSPSTVYTRDQLQAMVDALDYGTGYQYTKPPAYMVSAIRTGADIVSTAYDGYREYQATSSVRLQPGFSFAATQQTDFSASIGNGGNQNSGTFPSTDIENLVITYYDNYDGNPTLFDDPAFQFVNETWQTSTGADPFQRFNRVKGQVTATSVRVLNTSQWLHAITYYDQKQRAIQTLSSIHTGGVGRYSTLFNFSGMALESTRNQLGQTIAERFTYDPTGRMLKIFHKLNTQPEVILSAAEYDEKGQVIDQKLYSTNLTTPSYLQSIDYGYNIKGWLTKANSAASSDPGETDYFAYEMAYEADNFSATTSSALRKDGMVTTMKWRNDLSSKQNVYTFNYDNLSRLSHANFKSGIATPWASEADFFSENNITYDLNGNITGLDRRQKLSGKDQTELIDDLTYGYGSAMGNQLMSVTEGSTTATKDQGFKEGNTGTDDYVYDKSGNLVNDKNKGITITYNFLNLPERITFSDNGYLLYTYDATGNKLKQEYYAPGGSLPTTKTDYVGEEILVNDVPVVIFHEEGRLLPPSYTNLIENREANGMSGFTASGNVTLSSQYVTSQTYVRGICNVATGTPGITPIGGTFSVKAGESYSFKVFGYQSSGTSAKLYASTNLGVLSVPVVNLPSGSANEAWATVSFVIPSGANQLTVGVVWATPASGNTVYINRVALYKTDWEYQYFLRDQVGSPRVVLSTDPSKLTYTITFETENQTEEAGRFINVNYSNVVTTPAAANATPGGNESIRMNNGYRVGPARSMKVYPGDNIDASVYTYYTATSGWTKAASTTMASALITVMTGGAIPAVDGGINTAYQNSSGGQTGFLLSPDQGSTKPSAFLNYILFDENYTPLEAKSVPVGSTANTLQQISFSAAFGAVQVKEVGYMFVYLSYDNNQSTNYVYFDDLKITHQESHVVQVNDYYPFGLTSYSWVREGEYENRFLYQGKEMDVQTGWQDFEARQYDPALGRWFAADPAAQFGSPYLAMGNVPMMGMDPDGRFVHILIGAAIGGVINLGIKIAQGKITDFKSGAMAFAIGAVAGGVGAATGGSAFLAAGGGALGAGGFGAGFVAGAVGGVFSSPIQGMGNALAFGDPYQASLGGLATDAFIGGVTYGLFNGVSASINGRSFFTGGFGKPTLVMGIDGYESLDLSKYKLIDDAEVKLTSLSEKGTSSKITVSDVVDELPKTRPDRMSLRLGDEIRSVQAKLNLYPEVLDPRTGIKIPLPAVDKIVPKNVRVNWGFNERGAFIKEWYSRGYPTPKGGWSEYDIHHIVPREYGGSNNFWNLVPVQRTTHGYFNDFWRQFGGL